MYHQWPVKEILFTLSSVKLRDFQLKSKFAIAVNCSVLYGIERTVLFADNLYLGSRRSNPGEVLAWTASCDM